MAKPHQQADETEIFSIPEEGGLQECSFKPRAFNIIWGADNRYWVVPQKGVDAPAELVQVSWLEVTATTPPLTAGSSYEISFEVTTRQGAFGWNGCPLYIMAKVGKAGRYTRKKISLPSPDATKTTTVPPENSFTVQVPAGRQGDASRIHFGLYEVWTGRWKGGLQIHEARVKKLGKPTQAETNN
uniref:Protein PHLOEM PROTEIN 2-LIKE A9-like n=1 Tax=Rhizophora mucronata TaxID=61149 RepID=A0A2P2JPJ5_RHIMU